MNSAATLFNTQSVNHRFELQPKHHLIRHLELPSGEYLSTVPRPKKPEDDLLASWWKSYLTGKASPTNQAATGSLKITELFCGPGGLAQGVKQACHELGYSFDSLAAVDTDGDAANIYQLNHGTNYPTDASITDLVHYKTKGEGDKFQFAGQPKIVSQVFANQIAGTNLLLAGPPCQGHSNLNNKTRRNDPRNELYLTVPALAIAADIPGVIIENVTAVVYDHSGVVKKTKQLFENAGYTVTTGVLKASKLGWPQTRGRFFMVARKDTAPTPIPEVAAGLEREPLGVLWAIEDLIGREHDDFLDRRPKESADTIKRLQWFTDHPGALDLPNSERPDCHKNGTTYTSCYGRMDSAKPAPTLTTGFMTPGRGRFIHPTEARVLTPREAARIQGFPDTYQWVLPGAPRPKIQLIAKWLGDAVPMPLGYAATLSLLGPGPLPF